MNSSMVTFFPVGEKNGGMILIKMNNAENTTVLIDSAIQDSLIAEYCDVSYELKDRLPKDSEGRPYVDAFILTHRHEDHLKGFQDNFYLGPIENYKNEDEELKIIIKELWSSHNFWKPESVSYKLCDDAKAFNREMKRRIALYKNENIIQNEGDRAIIIGKDTDGKTEGLEAINYDIDEKFTKINNIDIRSKMIGYVLGPIEKQENEDDACFLDQNRQSIILQLNIYESGYKNSLLLASDAECSVWEALQEKYGDNASKLQYDILVVPHHCSWHALSYDSQSKDDNPQVCANAKKALSNKKNNAFMVSQSKIISDSTQDPPSTAAKREYISIIRKDQFICTNEYLSKEKPEPIEFCLTAYGPQLKSIKEKSKLSLAASLAAQEAYPHG